MNPEKHLLIDLSHTIKDGLITYKGLPAPIICDYWTREESRKFFEEGTEFQIGKIEMVANTGTYLDTPFHRYAEGKDLSEMPLESMAQLEAVKISIDGLHIKAIDSAYFENLDLKNKAVLVQTAWDIFWEKEAYFENHPYLTEDSALFLRDKGVKLVGIDSYNIDNTALKTRPVHSILLKAEIPIVEHLCNLTAIPDKNFYFCAVPPKIKGFGTFPVRAYAWVK